MTVAPSDYFALVGSIATLVTAIVAILALLYAKDQVKQAQAQLQQSHTIAHLDFLLRLDEAFQRHEEVHKRYNLISSGVETRMDLNPQKNGSW